MLKYLLSLVTNLLKTAKRRGRVVHSLKATRSRPISQFKASLAYITSSQVHSKTLS